MSTVTANTAGEMLVNSKNSVKCVGKAAVACVCVVCGEFYT